MAVRRRLAVESDVFRQHQGWVRAVAALLNGTTPTHLFHEPGKQHGGAHHGHWRPTYTEHFDPRTAEVVHIDFGIVFEQGKILQTPETVPFRLTRDMVDGLGITGGSVARLCCHMIPKSPPLKLRRYLSAMDLNTFLIRHTFASYFCVYTPLMDSRNQSKTNK